MGLSIDRDAAAHGGTPRQALGVAVLAAIAAALLGGCTAGGDEPTPVTTTATATGSPSAEPTPTATASPTASPTASATQTPAPAPPAPTPTAPAPTSPEPPGPGAPPPEGVQVHGGTAWGVYLAVLTSEDDPAWVRSGARLEELGYLPAYGDVSCDVGAPEALGLPDNTLVRSLHFGSRQDADQFARLYGGDVLGIVEVTTLCLD